MQLSPAVSFCCTWLLRDFNFFFSPCYNKYWTLLTYLFFFCFAKEVKDILHNVVLRNMVRDSMHIKKEAFEAWRRVIEVTLASCPADILPKDTRQTVIAELLQDLLSKVHCKGYFLFFTADVLQNVYNNWILIERMADFLIARLVDWLISWNVNRWIIIQCSGDRSIKPLHRLVSFLVL